MKIGKCYNCKSEILFQDREKYTKQTHPKKINLLLFKYKSGLWPLTKQEKYILNQYFLDIF